MKILNLHVCSCIVSWCLLDGYRIKYLWPHSGLVWFEEDYFTYIFHNNNNNDNNNCRNNSCSNDDKTDVVRESLMLGGNPCHFVGSR